MINRDASHCASRWKNMLDPSLVKGAWSKEARLLSFRPPGVLSLASLVSSRRPSGGPCLAALTQPKRLQEDAKVVELVAKYGPRNWTKIAQHLKGRIGKQCRERYRLTLRSQRPPPSTAVVTAGTSCWPGGTTRWRRISSMSRGPRKRSAYSLTPTHAWATAGPRSATLCGQGCGGSGFDQRHSAPTDFQALAWAHR
jgi:hypothetical protein